MKVINKYCNAVYNRAIAITKFNNKSTTKILKEFILDELKSFKLQKKTENISSINVFCKPTESNTSF